MMLKYLVSGALCSLLAVTSAKAAPPTHGHAHAHYNTLEPHCHCPKGYAFLKGQCVTEATTPKQPICPYQKSPHYADVCLKPIPAKNDCPEGFSLVPKVGCVKDTESPIEFTCPKGFFLNNDVCKRTFTVPKIYTCPNPTQFLQGEDCFEVITNPVTPVCQQTDAKGKCFLVQTGDNTLECPVGFTLVGEQCEKVEFAQKVYVCHWHYRHVFDKDADDHPTKKCPKVVHVPCHNQKHHHRKLSPEDGAEEVDETSEAGYPTNVNYLGSHGHVQHGHEHAHEHNHTHLVHKVVPKQCTKTEYYPAKGRCPRGFTPIDAAAQKYVHSHQYHKKEKPQCYRVEIVAPQIVCIDKMVEGECTKIVQIPFDLTCQAGESRVGKKCVFIDSSPAGEDCPPFSEKVYENSGFRCVVTRTIPAKPTCPVGFEMKGKQCLQLTIVKPRVCPSFAVEKHGNCFVKVDPIYQCPKGFEPSPKDHTLCTTTKTINPVCEHKHQQAPAYPWVNNAFLHSHGHY